MLSLKSLKKKRSSSAALEPTAGPSLNFWEQSPPSPPDMSCDGEGFVWSVRFKGFLRIVTNKPFQSLQETMAVASLWEQEYSGFSAKRPFYRALLMIMIRRLRQIGQVSYKGQIHEYQSEMGGRGNFLHNRADLPLMRAGADTFSKSWDFNGRHGSILFKVEMGDLDPDPSYNNIFDSAVFSDESEFASSANILGVKYDKVGSKYILDI
ncbi:matrix protein [Puer bat vesiculovirus]|nr:matrix protein [Puer bat vesiculovirus]